MKTRLKELRKALGMTQQKFADSIGVKQNTVAQYEIGRNEPIDSVFSLICKEFNVNEAWLRDGTGTMFKELSRDEETAGMIARIMSDDVHPLKADFLNFAARLIDDDNCYESIKAMLLELAELAHKKEAQ